MKKFAIAFIDLFEYELTIHIVEATDWKGALNAAKTGYAEHVGDDLEAAKEEAFNQGWLFDVKEITS